MRAELLLPLLLTGACTVEAVVVPLPETGDTEPVDTATGPDPDTGGECGAVTTWDVTLTGVVVNASDNPVSGATVTLEDRGWDVGTDLATDVTNGSGVFVLDIVGLTSVENCWGSLLSYWVVAEEGSQTGERGVNSVLHAAILDTTLTADMTAAPLTIE